MSDSIRGETEATFNIGLRCSIPLPQQTKRHSVNPQELYTVSSQPLSHLHAAGSTFWYSLVHSRLYIVYHGGGGRWRREEGGGGGGGRVEEGGGGGRVEEGVEEGVEEEGRGGGWRRKGGGAYVAHVVYKCIGAWLLEMDN